MLLNEFANFLFALAAFATGTGDLLNLFVGRGTFFDSSEHITFGDVFTRADDFLRIHTSLVSEER